MIFWNYIKPKIAYITLVSIFVSLFSFYLIPTEKVSADAPVFNRMKGDAELLTGTTETGATREDPISGTAGDTFRGVIYYHNGTENETVANNTKVRVSIPTETAPGDNDSHSFLISAAISADNVSGITTDTIVDGVIVGKSGLTTFLSQSAQVEFVRGSVKWYPENAGLNAAPVSFPSGQTGDEIIGNGVNLGDIKSCWDHSGLITFLYKTAPKEANLTLDKKVQNVTLGESAWNYQTNAKEGEKVAFKIDINNSSTVAISGVSIKDSLPGDLEYEDGSLMYSVNDGTFQKIVDPIAVSQFFNGGYAFGGMNKNDKYTFKFISKVGRVTSDHTVVNQATAFTGQLTVKDTANVVLATSPIPAEIKKSKSAFNLTSGASGVNFTAKESDVISYTLTTKNEGGVATQVTIEDGVADILDYSTISEISDGGTLIDGTVGNDEKIVRYPAVSINPGQSVTRTFKATVKNVLPNTPPIGYRFDHIMFNKYGNDVTITLPVVTEGKPVLKIEKKVRNISASESSFAESNKAKAGDILEYQINFSNDGNAPANYLKISDVLPANVQFMTGTTIYSIDNDSERTLSDGITGEAGVSFNTLQAGGKGYVRFKVKLSANLAKGESLVNTGYAAAGSLKVSDTASTTIEETPAQPVPTPQQPFVPSLPKTGASTMILSFLFAISLLTGISYLSFQKKLRLLTN